MKVPKILGVVFAAIGGAFLAVALALYANTKAFSNAAERADGIVVEYGHAHGRSYHPVVKYQTREREEIIFESTVGSNPPSYEIGEHVTVLYDPAQPDDASIDNFLQLFFLPAILGGIGTLFFAIGGGLLIGHAFARRKREQLMASGRRISTKVQGVDHITSVRLNGRHPYCITSQWINPDTGAVHVFRSEGIWYDPSDHLKGDTIDVLIDPMNPKRYYVDTSFLPKEA